MDRRIPPAFSSNYNLTLPIPKKFVLANNARIYWLDAVEQDVTKIEFVFDNGKWAEPKNGISFFTASLIDKGTVGLDSNTIAEKLDELGAQIECVSGMDYFSLSLYTLNRNLERALALVTEILREATFPEHELSLARQIQLQNLKISNEKTNVVASRILKRNIFGVDHPYGRSLDEASMEAIQKEDLITFHKNLSANSAFITGNLRAAEIKSVISFLEQFQLIETQIKKLTTKSLAQTDFVEKPGSVQSSIRLGKVTINKHDQDFAALTLLNHILGGYFGSRLMKNIREEKGLTYGINSSITSFVYEGAFLIGAEVNKENVNLTIDEIHKEIMRLHGEPVPSDELAIAKTHLIGSLQLELSTPFSVMEKIKSIALNNLATDYYDNLLRALYSTNAQKLQELSIRNLYLNGLTTVIVG